MADKPIVDMEDVHQKVGSLLGQVASGQATRDQIMSFLQKGVQAQPAKYSAIRDLFVKYSGSSENVGTLMAENRTPAENAMQLLSEMYGVAPKQSTQAAKSYQDKYEPIIGVQPDTKEFDKNFPEGYPKPKFKFADQQTQYQAAKAMYDDYNSKKHVKYPQLEGVDINNMTEEQKNMLRHMLNFEAQGQVTEIK